MKPNLLAAVIAASLVSGGVASAAETRSATALPAQSAVKAAPAAYSNVVVSRSAKQAKQESQFAGVSIFALLLGGAAIIAAIYFATKSKG